MLKNYLKISILFFSFLSFVATASSLTSFFGFHSSNPNPASQSDKPAPKKEKISSSGIKGIYLTQWTLENTNTLSYLIKRAKAAGIDTFVVDLEIPSKRYRDNIALLKENGIKYVARVVMFPDGGTKQQVENPEYWQRKYNLVQQAINWGANAIQLDYIRYNTKQAPSEENSKRIHEIIKWYKNKLASQKVPLEIDVFGVASYGESKYIGQNIKLFSQSVDAICPMVYPSHYVPFREHFNKPYETIADSLESIHDQFAEDKSPVKLIPYIELSNYHFPMNHQKTLAYIRAQIKAVKDSGADGWYAWSPHNRYNNLFEVLENN